MTGGALKRPAVVARGRRRGVAGPGGGTADNSVGLVGRRRRPEGAGTRWSQIDDLGRRDVAIRAAALAVRAAAHASSPPLRLCGVRRREPNGCPWSKNSRLVPPSTERRR